jgi:hypothetical protein
MENSKSRSELGAVKGERGRGVAETPGVKLAEGDSRASSGPFTFHFSPFTPKTPIPGSRSDRLFVRSRSGRFLARHP